MGTSWPLPGSSPGLRDPSDKPKDPDHIGDITRLHGACDDGAVRWVLFDKAGKVAGMRDSAPVEAGHGWKELLVSRVFDNEETSATTRSPSSGR